MRADRFIDTNILIYAFAEDPARSLIAEQVLAEGGRVSVQVLNEFANVCRRKLALTWKDVKARLDVLRALLGEPMPVTVEIHDAALKLAEKYGLSVYDALIVAAAAGAGCATIESEDMQHGAKMAGVRINNPFQARP